MVKRQSPAPSPGLTDPASIDAGPAPSTATAQADPVRHHESFSTELEGEVPPPAYGAHYGEVQDGEGDQATKAVLTGVQTRPNQAIQNRG